MKRAHRAHRVAAAFAVSLAVHGCMLMRAREDQERLAGFGRLQGHVRAEHPSDKPLLVVLLGASSVGAKSVDDLEVVDHFVRVGPGSYAFGVKPGIYYLVAFEDLNSDGKYDPDEPLLSGRAPESRVEVVAGQIVERDLVIPTEGRARNVTAPVNIAELQARSIGDQVARSIGALLVRGEVADLADAKFGAESAHTGLWQPLEFVIRVGAGIYLTEPYDPERIPVLFVHGIDGYPQQFTQLIDSLDHERFQAWFFFYPSGARLDAIAGRGADLMTELQLRYDFRDFAVVAHSMGGLVSRDLIFQHVTTHGRADIPLFVTISTPWGGDTRAIAGVEKSPVVVGSWRDMASNSQFLKDLFWDPKDTERPRRLPSRVAWHMLFSIHGASRGDESTDGSVTVASQLRLEAQQQVLSQLGLDYSHTGILESPEALRRVNRLLAARFD